MTITIAEVSLDQNKRCLYCLTKIRGIGLSTSKSICLALNIDESRFLRDLDENELRSLSEFITTKFGDVIGSNLRRAEQRRIQELMALGNYRGLRHRKRMPVRGQRTSSNARTRRGKAIGKSSSGKSNTNSKMQKK